jgi:hypothetical protein
LASQLKGSTGTGPGVVRHLKEEVNMAEFVAVGVIVVLAAVVLVVANGLEKL